MYECHQASKGVPDLPKKCNLHLLMVSDIYHLTLLVVKQCRCMYIHVNQSLLKQICVKTCIIIHVSSGAVCEDKKR